MGLFTKKPQFVQVVYFDLAQHAPEGVDTSAFNYSFRWEMRSRPAVGQWVWINGSDGPTTGVVVSAGAPTRGIETKPVLGLVTPDQWDQFSRAREYNAWKRVDDRLVWLEMARQKAGFTAARDVPKRVPQPYETIPAIRGRVTGVAAKDRGRVWWRLYNLAVENGLPPEEIERFKEIADGWYERSRMKEPS